jgi:4'-phosphopantetheinyl transferase
MEEWVETKDATMTLQREMVPLEPQAVHIHLLRVKEIFSSPSTLLSEEELSRMSQFSLESRRQEYAWSRLLLRQLSAFYLKIDSREIRFDFQEGGKPILEKTRLRFNLSHTQGLIACSFAWREVGIDVEKTDLSPEAFRRGKLLAERYFSPREVEFLRSQPLQSQGLLFFQLFTMKEATIKARGQGLGFSLSRFTVPLPPRERAYLGGWEHFARTFEDDGYCLAQVTKNTNDALCEYQIYDWDPESLISFLNPRDPARDRILIPGVF